MLVLGMTLMAIRRKLMLSALALEPMILKKVPLHFWKNVKLISLDHDHWLNQA